MQRLAFQVAAQVKKRSISLVGQPRLTALIIPQRANLRKTTFYPPAILIQILGYRALANTS